jgi:hypothetical protein
MRRQYGKRLCGEIKRKYKWGMWYMILKTAYGNSIGKWSTSVYLSWKRFDSKGDRHAEGQVRTLALVV